MLYVSFYRVLLLSTSIPNRVNQPKRRVENSKTVLSSNI